MALVVEFLLAENENRQRRRNEFKALLLLLFFCFCFCFFWHFERLKHTIPILIRDSHLRVGVQLELGARVVNDARQRYREQKTTSYNWITFRAKNILCAAIRVKLEKFES